MAVRIKFSLLLPFLLVTLLSALFSLDTRIDSEVKCEKVKLRQKALGVCRRWRLERERLICWDSKQSSHFKWAEFTFEIYSNQSERSSLRNVGLRVHRNCVSMLEYMFVLASVRAWRRISLRNVSLAPNQSSRIILCTHCKSKFEVLSPEIK